jgi:hypothetical protein
VEQGAGILRGLEEQDVVLLLRDIVAERAVARRYQVRMRVDEAGQDRRGPVVSPVHGCAVGSADLGGAAQTDDAVPLDEQCRLVDGRGPGAVEEAARRDQREARGWLGHAVVSLSTDDGARSRQP